MQGTDTDESSVARRAVLERVGASTLLAVGATGTSVASEDGSDVGEPVTPVVRRPEIRDAPGVTDAEISVNADGSVTKELRFEADLTAGRRRDDITNDGQAKTAAVYSLDLELEDEATVRRRVERDGEFGTEGFAATLEGGRRSLDPDEPVRAAGIPDGPSPGTRDFVTFCHTKSQECGPLARTNSLADVDGGSLSDRAFDREMVDGAACEGAEWDATFEVFCDVAQYVPGIDCSVPSVFDTTWNAPVRLREERADGMTAATVFTCGNFPAIPETVVSVHRVDTEVDGTTVAVDWAVTHGVVPWNDTSDYELDWNGIANVIVDGLSAAFPTEPYSFLLAQYLLADDGGIVY